MTEQAVVGVTPRQFDAAGCVDQRNHALALLGHEQPAAQLAGVERELIGLARLE